MRNQNEENKDQQSNSKRLGEKVEQLSEDFRWISDEEQDYSVYQNNKTRFLQHYLWQVYGMTSISDRLVTLHELVEKSHMLSQLGRYAESNDYYIRASIIAENLIKTHDTSMFTESELEFISKILSDFNYE